MVPANERFAPVIVHHNSRETFKWGRALLRSAFWSALVALSVTACGSVSPSATPTSVATPTATAAKMPTVIATPTLTLLLTATPLATSGDDCATASVVETNQAETDPTVIVAIGDSLTSGGFWSFMDHKNTVLGGWVTRLQDRLDEEFPGEFQVINQGENSITARGVLGRIKNGVVRFCPSVVLVQIGSNDVVGATTVEGYQSTMEAILKETQEQLPESSVFLVGFTAYVKKYAEMAYSFLSYDSQDLLDAKAERFNDVLKVLAEESGAFYIDIPSHWPEDIEERWELLADGLHPNDAGYDLMTEVIYSALSTTVISPSDR